MFIKAAFCCLVLASLLVVGCSGRGNSEEVDGYLDGFQIQVSNWEAKMASGNVTIEDLHKLTTEGNANASKITELSRTHKFSEAQGERAKKLGVRFQKVTQKMVRNATQKMK